MNTVKEVLDHISSRVIDPKSFSKGYGVEARTAIGEGNKDKYHSVNKSLHGPLGKFSGNIGVSYHANIEDPDLDDIDVQIGFHPGDGQAYGGYNFHRDWMKYRDLVAKFANVNGTSISKGFEEDGNGVQKIKFRLPKKNPKQVLDAIIDVFNELAAGQPLTKSTNQFGQLFVA